ncbi:MAG TPA: 5'-3' exonuclease H3TH domain-containing protein, partial [Bellilinea sp.]|nr:5'-3' exonuclease H3TH domain-containing protein [Bellilinea sp.]
ADDVLGTIARAAEEKGLGVKIITGDRDLLQLVDDRVIVNLAGNKLSEAKDFTEKDVVASLGVRPDQVIDYKALIGDTSDNIPGVKGVGSKTAIKLLEQYDTLDAIYENIESISGRTQTLLKEGKESAYLSKELATIKTDIPIALDLEKADTTKVNYIAGEDFFNEMDFKSLVSRMRKITGNMEMPTPAIARRDQLSLFGDPIEEVGNSDTYQLTSNVVDTPEKLADLAKELAKANFIALDTETTSTDPMLADLVGISLAV